MSVESIPIDPSRGHSRGRGRSRGHSRGRGRGRGGGRGRGRGGASSAAQRESHDTPPPKNSSVADKRASTASTRNSRRRFGARLTEDAPECASPAEPMDLRSRLEQELESGEYDCIICFNTVARKNAVWACSRCYAVFHLGCVRKWAEKSVAHVEEHNAMHEDPDVRNAKGTWRCPGCQQVREDIPTKYYCWCGRQMMPKGNGPAHSCGKPCPRACSWHGCAACVCHPGPCPPCPATISVPCYCGKQHSVPQRCTQLRSQQPELSRLSLTQVTRTLDGGVSCNATCGKLLACGVHTCEQSCHPGDCAKCSVEVADALCHCGKERRAMQCGDRDFPSNSTLWSCGNTCGELYDCGIHTCSRPCHVRTGTKPCPYAPQRVTACPCGRTPVTGRAKCTDPIPECKQTCGRIGPCGHACTATCHEGDCPPCTERTTRVCRCGEEKRAFACSEAPAASDTFCCTAVCRTQRHCGRHKCTRTCCPLSYQASITRKSAGLTGDLGTIQQQLDPEGLHACDLQCGRTLSCGTHQCIAPCHRGACPPCLQSCFEEVACPCGRTVLEPPVPCGTQINCPYPCPFPPPACGHEKVPHSCHPHDTPCPPCVHLTNKSCICGRNVLKAVACSRTNVRCGTPCGELLSCGIHRCTRVCHVAPDDCPDCTHRCNKPLPLCGHACQKRCHAPEPCPEDEECTSVIVRRCACGHLEKMEVCGMSTAAAAAGKTPQSALECTNACRVAVRNARFADALGLAPKHQTPSFSNEFVRFFSLDRRAAMAVQQSLCDFVQSPRASVSLRHQLQMHSVRTATEPLRITQSLLSFAAALARVFDLETTHVENTGAMLTGLGARGADLDIRRVRTSHIPQPLPSELLTQPHAELILAEKMRPKTPAAPKNVWKRREFNAVIVTGLPETLAADATLLNAALEDASLSGRRRWQVEFVHGGVVLHDIRLEPLSLAAVTRAAPPPELAALSSTERRLATFASSVRECLQHATAQDTLAAELAEMSLDRKLVRRQWEPEVGGGTNTEAAAVDETVTEGGPTAG